MEYLSEKVIHQPEVNDREGARHAKVVRERETETERQKEIPVLQKERVLTEKIPRIGTDLLCLRTEGSHCGWGAMGAAQDGPPDRGQDMRVFYVKLKSVDFILKSVNRLCCDLC